MTPLEFAEKYNLKVVTPGGRPPGRLKALTAATF